MTDVMRSAPSVGAKKKFATPPVKIACLSCRASRTRCDGGKPCASCRTRDKECEYRPSRRGGARVRRKRPPEAASKNPLQVQVNEMPETPQEPIPLTNYVDPGAGLVQLQDMFQDSDFIFDTLFMTAIPGSTSDDSSSAMPSNLACPPPIPMVRTYQDDSAILEAYYVFIHPYFPILPAPSHIPLDRPISRPQNHVDEFEAGFEPSSPISLAISAILALIPCPDDVNYLSQESVMFRRKYSHYLAQSAIEGIESEHELPDSSTSPERALQAEDESTRLPFHAGVPQELESIIALDLLSVYEYAQRGNIKKMQRRAMQALMSAMQLFLHTNPPDDGFAEAKRRVWWMTYICTCQGSIVSNSKPMFETFLPSFSTAFPIIESDPEAFPVFIQAQQAILGATQFVIELNRAVEARADMSQIYEKMKELELLLEPLSQRAEAWNLPSSNTTPVDPSEEVLGRSLRAMAQIKLNSARIKLHRYCAFHDLPVFTGKHCDLKAKTEDDSGGNLEPRQLPTCCSSFTSLPTSSPESVTSTRSSPYSDSTTSGSSSVSTTASSSTSPFPFNPHQSAKICLRAALNIANSFDELPYPNPTGQLCSAPIFLSPTSAIVVPRTMPSFACCAMQCAYALLMIHQRTNAFPESANNYMVGTLLARLQHGLTSILATLENYAIASEALGGMREQIRKAIEPYTVFKI
ncbi:Sorbicillinoid biosynthetic cluster transcription factor sor3 [Diplogelasinospora grovesii]|uniref:Sorbicillinoid biosynthetic cluster transcription factor sor3 n=1 Tax=Diplogelasinospora grovesii TaxID=303347 RepID=A0AAN6RZZ4_9PEZI|nr:Sorbicillinoid biosynthetic cluster transcription factor sor3 [Diplogelasinospora grovesii]